MSRTFGKIAQLGYVVRDIDVDRVQTDYFC